MMMKLLVVIELVNHLECKTTFFSSKFLNFAIALRPAFEPQLLYIKGCHQGFPGGAVGESPPANAGDTGSSPGLGRSHMPRSN